MSRIAGVVGPGGGAPDNLLRAMLSGPGTTPGSAVATQGFGAAAFAVQGWRENNLHVGEGLLVAMDGMVFDRPDVAQALGADAPPVSAPDAALIAALFRRHGFAGALARINGDFAVALWNEAERTLWLGRDRFGIKPLYWAQTASGVAFASRLRALLTVPGVSKEPRREFVALFAGSHYRTFDNDRERSPYTAISQLPAAHVLAFEAGRAARPFPYWSLIEQPDLTVPEAEIAEQYRALLLDAVDVRARAGEARRPAYTLSGGMDSSSVLACRVERTGQRQHAYSTVYEDATYDETDEIRSMLGHSVEEWHPVRLGNPDLEDVVSRMIDVNDEPVATATWLSHYVLCRQVQKDGFGGLFGGLGGDELNAGEYEYFFFFFGDLSASGDEAALEHETRKWIEYHDHPIFRKTFEVMREGLVRLIDPARPGVCLPDRRRLDRYAGAVRRDWFDLRSYTPVMDAPFRSYLKNRTYQDVYRETAPCCLRAADRQGTAFGLEIYWPFFDHRLVELMFRVPARMKIREGVTKHVLREAMRGILPEETRTRVKKTGWNAPAHVWFSGRGEELLRDILGSQAFRERGIYDVAEVSRLLDEHQEIVSGRKHADNHMMFFWQLLNLELWLRANDRLSGA